MWSWSYCLLVFLAVLGVLQLAAARNNYRGLLFFRFRALTLVFGLAAIGFALFAFFAWNEINDYIVEGSQQTGSFVVSALAAIIFTLAGSSVLNHRRFTARSPHAEGLDVLRVSTFFQAIRRLTNGNGK